MATHRPVLHTHTRARTQIAHDPELLKDELRPLVFEEVRQQVDDEMRCLLANLKAMVAAEAAAKSGGRAGDVCGRSICLAGLCLAALVSLSLSCRPRRRCDLMRQLCCGCLLC